MVRFGGADYRRQGDLWPRIRGTDAVGRGFWPFGEGRRQGRAGMREEIISVNSPRDARERS